MAIPAATSVAGSLREQIRCEQENKEAQAQRPSQEGEPRPQATRWPLNPRRGCNQPPACLLPGRDTSTFVGNFFARQCVQSVTTLIPSWFRKERAVRSLKNSHRLLIPVALGAGLAIGAVGISGAAAPRAETSAKSGSLTVDGTGSVKGKPDTITLSMGVDVDGGTVSAALSRSNDRANALLTLLKNAGVKEDDIATSNFSIWPNYDKEGTRVTGYHVSNMVTATLRDLAKAGETIDAAARAVGDEIRMSGVSFGIADDTGMVEQARQDAVKNARSKADQLAKGAGLKVLRVKTITETSAPETYPVAYSEKRAANDAQSSVPLSAGTQSREVTVRVVYEIG